jgi:GAF domain-containing protein
MRNREAWLADTLVKLADTLIAEFDIVDFLSSLVERIAELLEAADVGLVLVDPQGQLRVMAASTERMHLVDLFEVQASEGPCLDCYRTGEAIGSVDLEGAGDRWPSFTPKALEAGFRVALALPMRLRDQVIGAVNVFHSTPTTLESRDVHLAQALVDVATIGLLHERAVRRGEDLATQLQAALNSRVVIEQAKGAVAERAGVDQDTAFLWLRHYARQRNILLSAVATAAIKRELAVDDLRNIRVRQPRDHTTERPTS